MIQSGNATLLQQFSKDYFAVDVEMTKINVYMRHHQTRSFSRTTLVRELSQFDHGDISYRFNRKNDNAMLE